MNNTQRISHIISNHIFIFATSLAMLVHSTWTFGTLFSGKQPEIDGSLHQWISYLLWVTPALLVALAIDVGQIQTSVKLSNAVGTRQNVTLGITFITLACAGYYLQWFHLAHHIPDLEFGAGLSDEMRISLTGLKSMAIFIVPALLPLSTILYTLSSGDHSTPAGQPSNALQLPVDIHYPLIEETTEMDTEPYEPIDADNANEEYHNLTCEHCGWETGPRMRLDTAKRSLATHQARYCDALMPDEISIQNGHVN